MPGEKRRVLFLCIHNSARSQMAEGLLRGLGGARFDVASAGTEPTAVRPLAVTALAEIGIDISGQRPESVDTYRGEAFDTVITLCEEAAEACPVVPGGGERLHWPFPDPSHALGTEDEKLAVYRVVRDAIRHRIEAELL